MLKNLNNLNLNVFYLPTHFVYKAFDLNNLHKQLFVIMFVLQ
jgi:hypothetical protein